MRAHCYSGSKRKPHSTPGLALFLSKEPCVVNGLETGHGMRSAVEGSVTRGPMTEIVDRCQLVVITAGAAQTAPSGESAPWDREVHVSQRCSRKRVARDARKRLKHPLKANTCQRITALPDTPSAQESTHEQQVVEQWPLGLIEARPPEHFAVSGADEICYIGH